VWTIVASAGRLKKLYLHLRTGAEMGEEDPIEEDVPAVARSRVGFMSLPDGLCGGLEGASLSCMAPEPSSLFRRYLRAPSLTAAAGLLLLVAGAILIPADKTLGAATRWVFVHGAITWTGILCTLAAGVVALFVLLSGARAAGRAGVGGALFRLSSLALLFWAGSLGLSFPVMKMSWGGVLWSEPRLFMSVEIVFLLLVVWVVRIVSGSTRLLSFCALAAAAAMLALMVTTSGAFHPDNPIFNSGSPRFIGSFALLVAGMVALSAGVTLVKRRAA
jgi:hypothetical protein